MEKLSRKNQLIIGLTLFSMFFGAGNLIFPPTLGAQAGTAALWAFLGFAVSAIGQPAAALHETGADLRYTWPLPAPLPAGRYLNARAALAADGQIESLRLGEIRLPGGLIMLALDAGLRHSAFAAEFALLKRTVSQVRLAPDALRVTYTWQPELLASARALALTPAEQDGLAAAHQRLVEVMN